MEYAHCRLSYFFLDNNASYPWTHSENVFFPHTSQRDASFNLFYLDILFDRVFDNLKRNTVLSEIENYRKCLSIWKIQFMLVQWTKWYVLWLSNKNNIEKKSLNF